MSYRVVDIAKNIVIASIADTFFSMAIGIAILFQRNIAIGIARYFI